MIELTNKHTIQLAEFLQRNHPVTVLTGAGISTDSGIPDYRDHNGNWKRKQPVQHQEFMSSPQVRRRYWARSLIGWPAMQHAQPNPSHHQINTLERTGLAKRVITQNVDRLHQKAGSHQTIDLHGRADEVICMTCGLRSNRRMMHDACTRHLNLSPQPLHLTETLIWRLIFLHSECLNAPHAAAS